MGKIRVLVVDDSIFMRKIISGIIDSQQDMEVIATARDGREGLAKARDLQPDVITLDVEMPGLGGLEVLERLMHSDPRPVVMISSLTQENADTTLRALSLGAVDFVPKPSGSISLDLERAREEIWRKIRIAAAVPGEKFLRVPTRRVRLQSTNGSARQGSLSRVVVVGTSTGGPAALNQVMGALPADLAAGVVIVQHMPPGFTRSLAEHLDRVSALTVREAQEGDRLEDGLCLVAPGGRHLEMGKTGKVSLTESPPQHGVRPAVDVTLNSVAENWPGRSVAVIMTGMGMDGAQGAKRLKERGGVVIAQDEATCVVYGMSRVVVEMGVADRVVPLGEIPLAICQELAANGH